MATSRSLLLSVCLSGFVFSAATLPLLFLGSRPITVEVEEKPLLTGRIQDLASPYLGLVAGLSAGVGLLALSLTEWRNTARTLNQTRDRVSTLEQQLRQQEHQVESLKFSESMLQSQGLSFFLDPGDAVLPGAASLHSASTFAPVHANPAHYAASHNSNSHSSNSHSSIAHQSGFHHQASAQIEELKTALKQLTNQVEQLQNPESRDSIAHSVNPSVNASARA